MKARKKSELPKIRYGFLCLKEENLSFTNNTLFRNCKYHLLWLQRGGDGLFFLSYLTDFSYFPLKKFPKIAGHDLSESKMETLKGVILNNFQFFHFVTRIISVTSYMKKCIIMMVIQIQQISTKKSSHLFSQDIGQYQDYDKYNLKYRSCVSLLCLSSLSEILEVYHVDQI